MGVINIEHGILHGLVDHVVDLFILITSNDQKRSTRIQTSFPRTHNMTGTGSRGSHQTPAPHVVKITSSAGIIL